MNLIQNNPYRIVGLLAGATAKEQTKQISRLKKYIEAEQDPQDDFSFPALGNLNRTIESVEEAASKLDFDNDKICAAIFWFWNDNPITDEAAFEALKSGNVEMSFGIWDKLMTKTDEEGKRSWNPITEKNYSAFHNYSILNLIQANGNLHNAIVASLRFLESDLVHKFVSSVTDETYKTSKKELQLLFLNQLHSDILANKKSSLPKFLEILNKQEFVAKQDFMRGFVQKPIEQIEHKIETAKNKRKVSKANAAEAGQELFTTTASDLAQLKSVVGANELKYTSIADKVANEILQCSIDYFNDSQEKDSNSDYAETAMKLAKQAETLAVGNLAKDRVKDSIETLVEMKDKELSQAIAILQSIKDAYEEACRQIDKQIDELQYDTFPGLGGGSPLRFPKANVSINWSKVEEMKRNCLAWDKVSEVVREAIPSQNIEKIKRVSNTTKVIEYKTLVDFLMSKISYTYKNRIAYINYWEVPKTTSIPSASTSTSRQSTRVTTSSIPMPPIKPPQTPKEKSWFEQNTGCGVMLIIGAIIGLVFFLNNLNADERAFNRIDANTMSSYEYESFLREYPNSEYVIKAYDGLLRIAENEGLQSLDEFADKFGHTSQGKQAKQTVSDVSNQLYNNALLKNTIDAWKDYKLNVPSSEYRDADDKIEKIEELKWGTDSKAWMQATSLNTVAGYNKYLSLYPYGNHIKQAEKRIIDLQVANVFAGDYGQLPSMDKTGFSYGTKSTIFIKNGTSYTLTLLYSGQDSKRIIISPNASKRFTLPNGKYRIAASVSAANVRSFAGTENLSGGEYEVQYYIQTSRY